MIPGMSMSDMGMGMTSSNVTGMATLTCPWFHWVVSAVGSAYTLCGNQISTSSVREKCSSG